MAGSITPFLIAGLALSACTTSSYETARPARIAFADPDTFPESITSNSSGTLFISSAATGSVYRVEPGAKIASIWIPSARSGIREMLGVYADERSGVLYACSSGMSSPAEEADALSALYAFDLTSGALKASFPLPGGAASLCNDITVDHAGTVYVSDTSGGRILILPAGSATLREWYSDKRLDSVNGIALGGENALYVDTMMTGRLFRIHIEDDGTPGEMKELSLSAELVRPDALRAIGESEFLLAEGGGRVSHVEVAGDEAQVTHLKRGTGWSGVTFASGAVWAVNPKAEYRMDPGMAGRDPDPFFVERVDMPSGK